MRTFRKSILLRGAGQEIFPAVGAEGWDLRDLYACGRGFYVGYLKEVNIFVTRKVAKVPRMQKSSPGTLVVQAEELDDVADFGFVSHRHRDPSGLGQYVMRFGPAGGHEFIADWTREREISKAYMQVAQFAATKAKLDASETVVVDGDALLG